MAEKEIEVTWKRGYVQVYTGEGKGKTTAALGLAVRAAGAGLKTFIAQFLKGREYSELKGLEKLSDMISVKQYGGAGFITGAPSKKDIELARTGLEEAGRKLLSGEYRLIILDEANVATHLELFPVKDLLSIIDSKPVEVELVITGRNAAVEVIDKADLVTEMCNIKHYYAKGVTSRLGIED